MNGPIGHTFIYNLVILFIIIVFAFLSATLSYYKAFKVNNRIIHAIEKFEGYNEFSRTEINDVLTNFGYSTDNAKCKGEYKDMYLKTLGEGFKYCIYIDSEQPKKNEYYTYGVLTYMNLDLPIINNIDIPIFTRTNRIFKFTMAPSL